jgi:hypothetical protein
MIALFGWAALNPANAIHMLRRVPSIELPADKQQPPEHPAALRSARVQRLTSKGLFKCLAAF